MVELENSNDALNSIDEPIIEATLDMNGSGNLSIANMEIKKMQKQMRPLTTRDLIRATNEDNGMVMVGRIAEVDDCIVYITTTDGEDLMILDYQVTHNFGDVEDPEAFIAANPEYTKKETN